jgi:hypothetical protein
LRPGFLLPSHAPDSDSFLFSHSRLENNKQQGGKPSGFLGEGGDKPVAPRKRALCGKCFDGMLREQGGYHFQSMLKEARRKGISDGSTWLTAGLRWL